MLNITWVHQFFSLPFHSVVKEILVIMLKFTPSFGFDNSSIQIMMFRSYKYTYHDTYIHFVLFGWQIKQTIYLWIRLLLLIYVSFPSISVCCGWCKYLMRDLNNMAAKTWKSDLCSFSISSGEFTSENKWTDHLMFVFGIIFSTFIKKWQLLIFEYVKQT